MLTGPVPSSPQPPKLTGQSAAPATPPRNRTIDRRLGFGNRGGSCGIHRRMLPTVSGLPLVAILFAPSAQAGPWARPAGDVYAKIGGGHFEGQADFEDRQG